MSQWPGPSFTYPATNTYRAPTNASFRPVAYPPCQGASVSHGHPAVQSQYYVATTSQPNLSSQVQSWPQGRPPVQSLYYAATSQPNKSSQEQSWHQGHYEQPPHGAIQRSRDGYGGQGTHLGPALTLPTGHKPNAALPQKPPLNGDTKAAPSTAANSTRNVEKKSETHTCPICQAQVLIENWLNHAVSHGKKVQDKESEENTGEPCPQPHLVRGYKLIGELIRLGEPVPESFNCAFCGVTVAPYNNYISHVELLGHQTRLSEWVFARSSEGFRKYQNMFSSSLRRFLEKEPDKRPSFASFCEICETTFPMDKSHSAEHWSEHCAGSCQHAKKLRILLGKFDAAKRGMIMMEERAKRKPVVDKDKLQDILTSIKSVGTTTRSRSYAQSADYRIEERERMELQHQNRDKISLQRAYDDSATGGFRNAVRKGDYDIRGDWTHRQTEESIKGIQTGQNRMSPGGLGTVDYRPLDHLPEIRKQWYDDSSSSASFRNRDQERKIKPNAKVAHSACEIPIVRDHYQHKMESTESTRAEHHSSFSTLKYQESIESQEKHHWGSSTKSETKGNYGYVIDRFQSVKPSIGSVSSKSVDGEEPRRSEGGGAKEPPYNSKKPAALPQSEEGTQPFPSLKTDSARDTIRSRMSYVPVTEKERELDVGRIEKERERALARWEELNRMESVERKAKEALKRAESAEKRARLAEEKVSNQDVVSTVQKRRLSPRTLFVEEKTVLSRHTEVTWQNYYQKYYSCAKTNPEIVLELQKEYLRSYSAFFKENPYFENYYVTVAKPEDLREALALRIERGSPGPRTPAPISTTCHLSKDGPPGRQSQSPGKIRRRTRSPKKLSPRRRTGSPRRRTRSPTRRTKSPRRKVKSPKREAKSPKRCRRRTRSPRRQTRSPSRRVRSPRRQTRSSSRETRSPRRQTRSPSRRTKSRPRRTRSPRKINRSPRRRASRSLHIRPMTAKGSHSRQLPSSSPGSRSRSRRRSGTHNKCLRVSRDRFRAQSRPKTPPTTHNKDDQHKTGTSEQPELLNAEDGLPITAKSVLTVEKDNSKSSPIHISSSSVQNQTTSFIQTKLKQNTGTSFQVLKEMVNDPLGDKGTIPKVNADSTSPIDVQENQTLPMSGNSPATSSIHQKPPPHRPDGKTPGEAEMDIASESSDAPGIIIARYQTNEPLITSTTQGFPVDRRCSSKPTMAPTTLPKRLTHHIQAWNAVPQSTQPKVAVSQSPTDVNDQSVVHPPVQRSTDVSPFQTRDEQQNNWRLRQIVFDHCPKTRTMTRKEYDSHAQPSGSAEDRFVDARRRQASHAEVFNDPFLAFVHETLTGIILIGQLQHSMSTGGVSTEIQARIKEERANMHKRMITEKGHLLIRLARCCIRNPDAIEDQFPEVTGDVPSILRNLDRDVISLIAQTPIVI